MSLDLKEMRELLEKARKGDVVSQQILIESLDDVDNELPTEIYLAVREIVIFGNFPSGQHFFQLTACHLYAARGNLEALKQAIANEPTVAKQADKFGLTPLYDAIKHNQSIIIEFFKNVLGFSPNSLYSWVISDGEEPEKMQVSLLHQLARIGDFDVLKKVVEGWKVDLFCRDSNGSWPIHYAIENDCVELLPLLYDVRMRDIPDNKGSFLIHRAAEEHNCLRILETIDVLIKLEGGALNQPTLIGSPLYNTFFIPRFHEASPLESMQKRLDLAKHLIHVGLDINQMGSYGVEIQGAILGGSPHTVANSGPGPVLAPPIRAGNPPIQVVYAREAISVDRPTNMSLLHRCISSVSTAQGEKNRDDLQYYLGILKFLIENGARLDLKNDSGQTPLQLANFLNCGGAVHLIKQMLLRFQKTICSVTGLSFGSVNIVLSYLFANSDGDVPEEVMDAKKNLQL